MCTVVILRRPSHDWPVLLAANRDELLSRPWLPPARHWPDRADVVAGLDQLAGGTWMGMNESGVVACILNRHGTLGPAAGKRSRGELILEALDHADAVDAAAAMAAVDPAAYRPFNMVIADNRDAWWIALRDGATGTHMERFPDGLSMLTEGERNDLAEPRIKAYLQKFEQSVPPDPSTNTWDTWAGLMSTTDATSKNGTAMSVRIGSNFGTSSSSLVALPSADAAHDDGLKPIWLFAAGQPDSTAFRPVTIYELT